MQAQPLPKLRNEIDVSLRRVEGAVVAQLYDPLRHKFFDLSAKSTQILRFWTLGTAEALILRLRQDGLVISETDISTFQSFLASNNLVKLAGKTDILKHQQKLANSFRAKFSKLIFVKLRLGNPTRLLDALMPLAHILYSRIFTALSFMAGVLSVLLLMRLPHDIAYYAGQMYQLQGGILFLTALIIAKTFHEFGHAFQARLAGTQVNGAGIMFLFGFPLPFTELTDSWRLSSARNRLFIDAGGLLAEATLAAWCLLAFVFLPDGPERALVFYTATLSILLSLIVNLNPLMRFDGYHILSGLLNIKNLQARSNALSKWYLRKTLFNLDDPIPENLPPKLRYGLIFYGYAVWIYRFFLYLGIALIAYAMLSKVLGVTVFILEIVIFILHPILSELKVWKKNSMRILTSPRSWLSFIAVSCATGVFFVPMAHNVAVPARVVPYQSVDITAPITGIIASLPSEAETSVTQGDVIAILNSPELEFEFERIQFEIDRIKLQLSRLVSSGTARERREILASQFDEFTTEMAALTETASSGTLTARHSGVFFKNLDLKHEGQTVIAGTALGVLSNFDRLQYKMVVPSTWSDRIDPSKPIQFRDTDFSLQWPSVELKDISTTPLNKISEPEFAQNYGGDIQTAVNDDTRPKGTWYRASSQAFKRPDNFPTTEITGTATLQSRPISYAQRTWARMSQVLIKEWQF